MPNPLYKALSGGGSQNNRMSQFMSEFERFKRSFSGDPRAEIQRLLNSGQMTQEQYNKLAETAKQLSSMMPR
jgi:hypothetical protein